jgi:hypothetical protein
MNPKIIVGDICYQIEIGRVTCKNHTKVRVSIRPNNYQNNRTLSDEDILKCRSTGLLVRRFTYKISDEDTEETE